MTKSKGHSDKFDTLTYPPVGGMSCQMSNGLVCEWVTFADREPRHGDIVELRSGDTGHWCCEAHGLWVRGVLLPSAEIAERQWRRFQFQEENDQ